VRVSLLKLPGVLEVSYHPEADYFRVLFESVLVTPETILAAVNQAGRQLGQEYLTEIIR
jgi:hypothetical protein